MPFLILNKGKIEDTADSINFVASPSCYCPTNSASVLLGGFGIKTRASLSGFSTSPSVSSCAPAGQKAIPVTGQIMNCCDWIYFSNRLPTSSTSTTSVLSDLSHLLFKNVFSFLRSFIDLAIWCQKNHRHITNQRYALEKNQMIP